MWLRLERRWLRRAAVIGVCLPAAVGLVALLVSQPMHDPDDGANLAPASGWLYGAPLAAIISGYMGARRTSDHAWTHGFACSFVAGLASSVWVVVAMMFTGSRNTLLYVFGAVTLAVLYTALSFPAVWVGAVCRPNEARRVGGGARSR